MTSTSKRAATRGRGASRGLAATVLFAIAGLHVAWGLGSSFPFRTRDELADSVVGSSDVPSRGACLSVAAALVLSAILVARVVPLPKVWRTVALRIVTTVLATRGVAGAMGRTTTLSPGSDSPAFNRLDKRLYSPLCLWLAAGVQRSI